MKTDDFEKPQTVESNAPSLEAQDLPRQKPKKDLSDCYSY